MVTGWIIGLPLKPFVLKLFLFFLSLRAFPFVRIAFILTFHAPSHRSLPMRDKAGPWALQKLKTRLRQEQVEREEAASERYRQLEAKWNKQADDRRALQLLSPIKITGKKPINIIFNFFIIMDH
jgi:hypothetical protein